MIKLVDGLWQTGWHYMQVPGKYMPYEWPTGPFCLLDMLGVGAYGFSVPDHATVVACPIDDADHCDVPEDVWNNVVSAVDTAIATGLPIVTMCLAGENRSGLASVIVLRRKHGMRIVDAVELVTHHSHHPASDNWLFWNKAFNRAVRKRLD